MIQIVYESYIFFYGILLCIYMKMHHICIKECFWGLLSSLRSKAAVAAPLLELVLGLGAAQGHAAKNFFCVSNVVQWSILIYIDECELKMGCHLKMIFD